MIALILAALLVYAIIGFAWGSFLHALTSPADDAWNWPAFWHGFFWPFSMAWLALGK